MRQTIIITGGDATFFPFLIGAIDSLRSHARTAARDLGVIDQGLTSEQRRPSSGPNEASMLPIHQRRSFQSRR